MTFFFFQFQKSELFVFWFAGIVIGLLSLLYIKYKRSGYLTPDIDPKGLMISCYA
jgi:hypothetical protein